jgi:WD40 repeat protein
MRGQSAGREPPTVASAKGIDLELLTCFATRSDKLFIVVTAPPLHADETDIQMAANAAAHSNGVPGVAVSPTGELLASGSRDGSLELWSTSDGTLFRQVTANTAQVLTIDFAPDGLVLASGSGEAHCGKGVGEVLISPLSPGASALHLKGHTAAVRSVVFSPDGSLLASASCDGTVKLWQVSDGALLRTLEVGSPINDITFSPDGSLLVSGSWDGSVVIWAAGD